MTSNPPENLLKVSTTSASIEEISEHINKPTIQCLNSCSLLESFMDDINDLKKTYSELGEKINNVTEYYLLLLLNNMTKERDYYKSHLNMPQNKVEAEDDDSDSKIRHEITLDILFMLKKKIEEM